MNYQRWAGTLFLAFSAYTMADPPDWINYQGKLLDGTNLVNGNVTMVFRVYTNESGGSFVFEETNIVTVVDGYYSILLGKHPNYGQMKKVARLPFAFLEVEIDGTALLPREEFTPPPFAQQASEHWRLFGYDIGHTASMAATNPWLMGIIDARANNGVGGSAYLDDNDGHATLLFPAAHEEKEISGIRFFVTSISGTSDSEPVLTAEVHDFTNGFKRFAAEPFMMTGAMANSWNYFQLTSNLLDRTLAQDEVLMLHYDQGHPTNGLTGFKSYDAVMFDIEVR